MIYKVMEKVETFFKKLMGIKDEKNIYQVICESKTSEGRLPKGFIYSGEVSPHNDGGFVPGEVDVMQLYYHGIEPNKKGAEKIFRLFEMRWSYSAFNSERKIAAVLRKYGTLAVIYQIRSSILDDSVDIDINDIFNYGYYNAIASQDEDLVKLGIALVGLVDWENQIKRKDARVENILKTLMNLALYEEFTLYVVMALNSFQKKDEYIRNIAEDTYGWGKIHAVTFLEPESDESRDWLLRKGCENIIGNAYLALDCAEKGNLIEALRRGSPDDELYKGISTIMMALLNKGIARGMKYYEHAAEAIRLFLEITKGKNTDIKHLWCIRCVRDWLYRAEIEDKEELLGLCDEILTGESCKKLVLGILDNPNDKQFFKAASIAIEADMDAASYILNAIKQNPVERHQCLSFVYSNPEYAKLLTEIYEEILPLKDMAAGTKNLHFPINLTQEHFCLDSILNQLEEYPKLGEPLIRTALRSPVISNRYNACVTLEEWCMTLDKQLRNISPEFCRIIAEIKQSEKNKKTLESIERIQEGRRRFPRMVWNSKNSILEFITESITPEGRLPDDFQLPGGEVEEYLGSDICYVPGAKDGIAIFHFGIESDEETATEIFELLKKDCENDKYKLIDDIAELIRKDGTLAIVNPVLDLVINEEENVPPMTIFEYAAYLIFFAIDKELVKLGIALHGLFDWSNNDKVMKQLKTLALYEEFTLYVVSALMNNRNDSEIIFSIVKKVSGWGKIHAIYRLEPETEEIREWILREGCDNDIDNAYLALECAEKGNMIEALRNGLADDELYESICTIIYALLDEGPVEGMSEYQHAGEALRLFLEIAEKRDNTIGHLWRVTCIEEWLEDSKVEEKEELLIICSEIIARSSWRETILEILDKPDDEDFFAASNVAAKLGMNVASQMIEAIKEKPFKYYGCLPQACIDAESVRKIIEIYEEALPIEDIIAGVEDFQFSLEYLCLDFVMQQLKQYPKTGERLIDTALHSPVVRNRNGACNVLEAWCELQGKSLKKISRELYSVLKDIVSEEFDEVLKERMKKLLC